METSGISCSCKVPGWVGIECKFETSGDSELVGCRLCRWITVESRSDGWAFRGCARSALDRKPKTHILWLKFGHQHEKVRGSDFIFMDPSFGMVSTSIDVNSIVSWCEMGIRQEVHLRVSREPLTAPISSGACGADHVRICQPSARPGLGCVQKSGATEVQSRTTSAESGGNCVDRRQDCGRFRHFPPIS